MVIPGLDKRLGGTTTLSVGFFENLIRHADVTLVTTYTDNEIDYVDDRFKNNRHVKLFPSTLQKIKFSIEQYGFLKKNIHEYDLVHIHGLWHMAAFPSARLAMKKGVPYILSPHGMLEPDAINRSKQKKELLWALGYRKVFQRAAAIHCTAKNEVANVLKFSPLATIACVPNGVNLPSVDYPKSTDQILFIGRLHPKKGVDRLMKAFAIVNNPSLTLIIAGTGDRDYEAKIKQVIREEKLSDRVKMIGFVDGEEKERLISESTFACVPSFSEGLPLVSLETMAAGTPLLITKTSNVPEVTEFDCGIELEDNEPETIAHGIRAMLGSDLKKKGANAREVVRNKFLWDKVAGDLYHEYQKIVAS
jgi:poly(glycerol-phosphate) alpha-glucosyltransferase